MKSKKILIIFITIMLIITTILIICLLGTDDTLDLQKDDKFSFSVKQIVFANGKKNYSPRGSITYNKGEWYSDFSTSNFSNNINKVDYNTNEIVIHLQFEGFLSKGEPSYWDWRYPLVYKIVLNKQIIKDIKAYAKINKSSSYYVYELSSDEKTSYGYARGICICNNLRVRETPNTSGSTIIKLAKWQEVDLIDCTPETSEIDGLKYPWYKCKLNDGTVGWVFGRFVKIFFEERDKNLIYKAFEKEGSEYTNQFITPDNS